MLSRAWASSFFCVRDSSGNTFFVLRPRQKKIAAYSPTRRGTPKAPVYLISPLYFLRKIRLVRQFYYFFTKKQYVIFSFQRAYMPTFHYLSIYFLRCWYIVFFTFQSNSGYGQIIPQQALRACYCALHYCPLFMIIFGRSPTGRAMRCNLFLPRAQHKKSISAAIPNAHLALVQALFLMGYNHSRTGSN
jgi:hypothetical protein